MELYNVININSNSILINTATNALVTSVFVGYGPFEIAVSPDGSKVYVSNLVISNVSVIKVKSIKKRIFFRYYRA
jgi:YVTN family beta-propeller protein